MPLNIGKKSRIFYDLSILLLLIIIHGFLCDTDPDRKLTQEECQEKWQSCMDDMGSFAMAMTCDSMIQGKFLSCNQKHNSTMSTPSQPGKKAPQSVPNWYTAPNSDPEELPPPRPNKMATENKPKSVPNKMITPEENPNKAAPKKDLPNWFPAAKNEKAAADEPEKVEPPPGPPPPPPRSEIKTVQKIPPPEGRSFPAPQKIPPVEELHPAEKPETEISRPKPDAQNIEKRKPGIKTENVPKSEPEPPKMEVPSPPLELVTQRPVKQMEAPPMKKNMMEPKPIQRMNNAPQIQQMPQNVPSLPMNKFAKPSEERRPQEMTKPNNVMPQMKPQNIEEPSFPPPPKNMEESEPQPQAPMSGGPQQGRGFSRGDNSNRFQPQRPQTFQGAGPPSDMQNNNKQRSWNSGPPPFRKNMDRGEDEKPRNLYNSNRGEDNPQTSSRENNKAQEENEEEGGNWNNKQGRPPKNHFGSDDDPPPQRAKNKHQEDIEVNEETNNSRLNYESNRRKYSSKSRVNDRE